MLILLTPPTQTQPAPTLPPGWEPLEELGTFLVHRERQPFARHRVACDLATLRRLGGRDAEAALLLLRKGAVRVGLVQDWLVDLSGRVRRERLEAFLDLHWTGSRPWREEPVVQRYLRIFSRPANTGDVVRLCFEPEGRLWVKAAPKEAWIPLPNRDLCRALLEGLVGPKALDQGLPQGLRESLAARLAP